jgi:hypothetical protein
LGFSGFLFLVGDVLKVSVFADDDVEEDVEDAEEVETTSSSVTILKSKLASSVFPFSAFFVILKHLLCQLFYGQRTLPEVQHIRSVCTHW